MTLSIFIDILCAIIWGISLGYVIYNRVKYKTYKVPLSSYVIAIVCLVLLIFSSICLKIDNNNLKQQIQIENVGENDIVDNVTNA